MQVFFVCLDRKYNSILIRKLYVYELIDVTNNARFAGVGRWTPFSNFPLRGPKLRRAFKPFFSLSFQHWTVQGERTLSLTSSGRYMGTLGTDESYKHKIVHFILGLTERVIKNWLSMMDSRAAFSRPGKWPLRPRPRLGPLSK